MAISLRSLLLAAASLAVTGCSPPMPAEADLSRVPLDWPAYGGASDGRKYSPADDITPETVHRLRLAWVWRLGLYGRGRSAAGDEVLAGAFQATPVAVNDTLYFSTPLGGAVALDGTTGREIWAFDPGLWRWPPPRGRGEFVHRGVAVWSGESTRRVFLNSRWRLFALDAATGLPIAGFGSEGSVALSEGLRWPVDPHHLNSTSPPVIVGNTVIVGSSIADDLVFPRDPPGAILAFDVRSGARLWKWEPYPPAGSPEASTWPQGALERVGHMNAWAPMTVDTSRGLLFAGISGPSNDWYGGGRVGDNLYAQSIVCIDVATGALRWYFQLVRHDLWDYDPASPPILHSMVLDGDPVEAVTLPAKNGFLYVFERTTGRPVWPFSEVPAPSSNVPGEVVAPVQFVPAWPPPFARQGIDTSDLLDFTPALRSAVVAAVAGRQLGGLFTPPSLEGTMVMPGWLGGAGWGGAAVDEARRLIFIKSTDLPTLRRLVPADSLLHGGDARYVADPKISVVNLRLPARWSLRPPFRHRAIDVPVHKPPYGTLVAMDLDSGEPAWRLPIGDRPEMRRHPDLRGIASDRTGVPGPPGPLATAGGVVFVAGGSTFLHAIESASGVLLRELPLGGEGLSNPMTFRSRAGQQFVIVAVGRDTSAKLMAFALTPKSSARGLSPFWLRR